MTRALRLHADLYEQVVEHCLSGRPNEACGLFASDNGRIVKVFPMTNAAGSPVRYSLDPKEQLAVYRALEEQGWELGGVFHSHTRTEAYPSPTDVRLASEDVPYVIVSLADRSPSIRAFRIVKDNWTDPEGRIEEIQVTLEHE